MLYTWKLQVKEPTHHSLAYKNLQYAAVCSEQTGKKQQQQKTSTEATTQFTGQPMLIARAMPV